MKFRKIGMRNIKTAISVSICVALAHVFNREYIFYAAIASVIAMQSSVTDSFKAGKNRILGTMTGAVIGFVCAFISPNNIILCGVGIIILIFICNSLGWNKSITISCIVFLAIMLNLNGRSPFMYSINRIIDTFIGITVAVLVNYFILPPKHWDKLYDQYILAIDRVFIIIEEKLCNHKKVNLDKLENEILKLEGNLNTYTSELRIRQQENVYIDKIKKIINVCNEIYVHLKIIESIEKVCGLNESNYVKVADMFSKEPIKEKEKDEISIVFNYHVEKILNSLDKLEVIKYFNKS
ncbi:FUSC family protein [Clostridium sp. JS66]|uniref:FUSC family protein n=1 Tax=Clostridium sp. JS66 TaxID=3064705 RepID=UPI00298E33A8|nr:aromatic acid exporter family protein [Clostridium sp. JS66]WPC42289.1 aromatic acid exporter family protein [Clostridium sp. JS66]